MGYKQADIDKKVNEVFTDVFYGQHKVYFEVGDSMGYVSDIKNNAVRTEGMSYGMMAACLLYTSAINKFDPDGNDDYFSNSGQFLFSKGDSPNIYVANGTNGFVNFNTCLLYTSRCV